MDNLLTPEAAIAILISIAAIITSVANWINGRSKIEVLQQQRMVDQDSHDRKMEELHALVELEREKQANQTEARLLTVFEERFKDVQTRLDQAEKDLERVKSDRKQALQELDTEREARRVLEGRLEKEQTLREALETDFAKLKKDFEALKLEKAQIEVERNNLRAEKRALQQRLEQMQDELTTTQQALITLERQLHALEDKVKNGNGHDDPPPSPASAPVPVDKTVTNADGAANDATVFAPPPELKKTGTEG